MKVEELAFHKTPIGDLILRRRSEPLLRIDEIFEVKLGDEFLMSSIFTEGETELSNIGLKGLEGKLDVVVGGLGLGYTAVAALEHEAVESLLVIDRFQEVIDWHQNGLVPMGERLSEDSRCTMLKGDFFDLARTGFDAVNLERKFDAVLLDIDHTPHHYLDEKNESFYGKDGLMTLKNQLKDKGIFALWSDDPPEEEFRKHLESVFETAAAYTVEFRNPYTNGMSINSVYTAKK